MSGDLVGNVIAEGMFELATIGTGVVIRTNRDARTTTTTVMMKEKKREVARLEWEERRRDETGWEG